MKILFLSDVPLDNPVSGSEQVLQQQALGLARQGMNVFAIARNQGLSNISIRQVENVTLACYRSDSRHKIRSLVLLLIDAFMFFRQFIKGGNFEIAICHQPFTACAFMMLGKLKNIIKLYVFHSPWHEEYLVSNENKSWLVKYLPAKARYMIEKSCLKRAQKIVALSRYMQLKIEKIHRIPDSRIVVNPGGVDLERFKPPENRESMKSELYFPENKIHLLTIRNLEPRMGLDNLLICIKILKNYKAIVHLVLGGDGIERKKLEDLVLQYGLENEVTMPGFIAHDTLPKFYGAADFFILPTRRLEGFGLVTPESMACGTPVLGTPVGATEEVLSKFNPQLLFKDASPMAMASGIQMVIKNYFNDKKKYAQLRERCRRYAEENYSWNRHTDQLKSILHDVINATRHR
jgi:glycosyltransferase involved in cell wall biosynthesis